mgnify:CR=1 FL=1
MSTKKDEISYDLNSTMKDARHRYFMANGFGEDGGYSKSVEWVKIGFVKLPVLNTEGRKHAVRFHDFHHILTGYHTDWPGECEIAGWEIGAGCGTAWVAWFLNLSAYSVGVFALPKRTFKAFVRGRNSNNLYQYHHDDLIGRTVAEVREITGVDEACDQAGLGDVVAFFAWGFVAISMALGQLAVPVVAILFLIGRM